MIVDPASIPEPVVAAAVGAFWAQDLYEHTTEETTQAMREALAVALTVLVDDEPVEVKATGLKVRYWAVLADVLAAVLERGAR